MFEDRYVLTIRDATRSRAIARDVGSVGLYAGRTPAEIIWNCLNYCVAGTRFRVELRVGDAVLSAMASNPQHCVSGASSFAGYPMRLEREPLKTGFIPPRLWPQWMAVINDWYDGKIDHRHSCSAIRAAVDHLPKDAPEAGAGVRAYEHKVC